jgi:hypothetical protein
MSCSSKTKRRSPSSTIACGWEFAVQLGLAEAAAPRERDAYPAAIV